MEKEKPQDHEAEKAPEYDAIYVFGSYPLPQRLLKEGESERGKEKDQGKLERDWLSRNTTVDSWGRIQHSYSVSSPRSDIQTKETTILPPNSLGARIRHGINNTVYRVIGRKPRLIHPSGLLYDTRLKAQGAYYMALHGDSSRIYTMLDSIRDWMDKSYAKLEETYIRKYLDERTYIKKTKDQEGKVIEMEEAIRKKKPEVEIIREEESFDLLTKVQQAQKISKEQGFSRIAIMVDGVHKIRTQELIDHIEKQGDKLPDYKLITWEEILTNPEYTGNRAPAFQRIKNHIYRSPYWQIWRAREWGVRRFDPEYISRRSRETRKVA